MRTVGLFEAKNKLSELAKAAAAGEEVVITRHGKPLVRLISASEMDEDAQRRRAETLAAIKAARATLKHRMTIAEILEARHADHKY